MTECGGAPAPDPEGWGAELLPRRGVTAMRDVREVDMLRGGLLWLLGIPLPIILILFFLGYLH
jgi:hypothetical protein